MPATLRAVAFVLLGIVFVMDAVGSVSLGGIPYALAVLLAGVACLMAVRWPQPATAAAGLFLFAAAGALLWLPYGHDLGVTLEAAIAGAGFLLLSVGFAMPSRPLRLVGPVVVGAPKAYVLVLIVVTWPVRNLFPWAVLLLVPLVACALLAWSLLREPSPGPVPT